MATTSTVAVAAHIGRVVGYASLDLFAKSLIVPTVLVTAAIVAGNAVGAMLQGLLSPRRAMIVEYGALVVCVALSVAVVG